MLLEILLSGTLVTLVLLAVLVVAGLVLASYLVAVRNNLVRLKNNLDRSLFDIDILMKQRHDEIPKLVGICKGYMQQREQKSLQAVTDARAAYGRARNYEEKTQAEIMINRALGALFTFADKYPDLKANSSFIQLRGRAAALEAKIAAQCSRYNDEVNAFNRRIAQAPHRWVARFMRLQDRPAFLAAETDRGEVQVKAK